MSALYPTEDTNHFPRTREIGLTTLAVGIIVGFPTAIAGSTVYLTFQSWRTGERNRARRTGIYGSLIAFLLFFLFQFPPTNLALNSHFYTVADLVLNYVGGFLGLVFVHTTVKKYERETLEPFELRWTRFLFTYLIGFGLVLTVAFSLTAITIWLNVCQIPGILNSYKTAIEFRGFKSALLQEQDVSSHCQHDWQWSSVSEEAESVDHYLSGSLLTINHELTKFPTPVQADSDSNLANTASDLDIDLSSYGNRQRLRCSTHALTSSISGIRCSLVIEYDYIVSSFFLRTFDDISVEELKAFLETVLTKTDQKIQRLDHP